MASSRLLSAVSFLLLMYAGVAHAATPAVKLQLLADRATVMPGQMLNLRLTVTNTSALPLSGLALRITYPAGQLQIQDPNGGTVQNGTITWLNGSLAANQTKTLILPATLLSTVAPGISLQLSGMVHAADNSTAQSSLTLQAVAQPQPMQTSSQQQPRSSYQPLPRTGASDFYAPLDNTARFLFAFQNGSSSGEVMLWSLLLLGGVTIGVTQVLRITHRR
jgi:hypothetical protein